MKPHITLILLISLFVFSCKPKPKPTNDKPATGQSDPVSNNTSDPTPDPGNAVQEGPYQAMEEANPGLANFVKGVMENMKAHQFLNVHEACDPGHFKAQVTDGGQDGESYLIEMFNMDMTLPEVPAGPLYNRLEQITDYTVTDFYEVEGDGFDYTIDGTVETAEGDADFTFNILIQGGDFFLIGAVG